MGVNRKVRITRGGKEIQIRKVWGGFCWPGRQTGGYCCAIGEELYPQVDERSGYYHRLFFIEEFVGRINDSNGPIEAAIEMEERWRIERWYGRGYHDKENTQFLNHWNRTVKKRSDRKLSIRSAYGTETDSIDTHLKILITSLKPESKILHSLENTRINEEYSTLSTNIAAEISCEEFPALAACGYVVTMLRTLTQESTPMFP